MAWLWWRQYRADRAEMLVLRLYLAGRDAQRQLAESIIDARRQEGGNIEDNLRAPGDQERSKA